MDGLPTRYRPSGSAAQGGMSTVVFCEDLVLKRPVAIKVLQESTEKRRMDDELAALLKMRSKHVVQIYDLWRFTDQRIAIIQEFVDGTDLVAGWATPASLEKYYRQIWQIASGIRDIHSVGVIHRDIKPNNMKTDPEGVIKLFDFGLARSEGTLASTMGFVGTPGFSAPELFATNPRFTTAIDVYAFGVTALFLAAGKLPAELLSAPPTVPPSVSYFSALRFPPAGKPVALPVDVAQVLNACLSKEAANRPTMDAVCEVLGAHLLFDKHQALAVYRGSVRTLNAQQRSIALELASIARIEIRYDGLRFLVTTATGEVFINNQNISAGYALPGCCVVALGSQARRASERAFITFDVSHPEVVL
jgi:serine/threonine-protein kinase